MSAGILLERRNMIRETLNALRLVRPRHLLKALIHPFEEIRAFKYHYRRVPGPVFVNFLSGAGLDRIDGLEKELGAHKDFHARLDGLLRIHKNGYGGQMSMEAPAIYSLVRLLRPRILVETGVADGFTSAYILQALKDNGEGRLYSIDLPSHLLPPGRSPGWIVEDRLRDRWDLRIGDAAALLPPLLEELGSLDFFMHDSLHTYEHMSLEFRLAWPRIAPGGLFLSHDVGQNQAFLDFMSEKGVGWGDWRVFHVLGGTRKPA